MDRLEQLRPIGPPRRSSITAKLTKEGINVTEVLQAAPTRLSNNTQRLGLGGGGLNNMSQNSFSLNPTPLQHGRVTRSGSGGKAVGSGSKIPTVAGRGGMSLGAGSNFPKGKGSLQVTGRQIKSAGKNSGKCSNLRGSNLPRSGSVDSIASATPSFTGFTPGGKSPRNTGQGFQAKLKAPDCRDKAGLSKMADIICQFLNETNFMTQSAQLTRQNITNISATHFVAICRHVSFLLFGPNFFTDKDDVGNKIMDLSSYLKYPGILKKSMLRAPGTLSEIAHSLLFLTFVCERARLILTPREPRNLEFTLQHHDVALECCKRLFYESCDNRPKYVPSDEAIARELEIFRSKCSELFLMESQSSKEELQAVLTEKMVILNKMMEQSDPRANLIQRKEELQKIMQEAENAIIEKTERLQTLSDIGQLEREIQYLASQDMKLQSEIIDLKKKVKEQPVSKIQCAEWQKKIESNKAQLNAMENANKKVKNDVMVKQEAIKELQQEFYEICTSFTIIESYNREVVRAGLDVQPLPVNPFDVKEFEEWANKVAKVHLHTTEAALSATLKKTETYVAKQKVVESELKQKIEVIRRSIEEKSKEKEKLSDIFLARQHQYAMEMNVIDQQLEEAKRELQSSKNEYNKLKQKKMELQEEMRVAEINKVEKEAHLQQMKQIWMEEHEKFRTEIAKKTEDWVNTSMAKLHATHQYFAELGFILFPEFDKPGNPEPDTKK